MPVRDLDITEWDLRFIIPARDLFRLTGDFHQCASIELFRVLHKCLRCVRDGYPVPMHGGIDVWAYRSYG